MCEGEARPRRNFFQLIFLEGKTDVIFFRKDSFVRELHFFAISFFAPERVRNRKNRWIFAVTFSLVMCVEIARMNRVGRGRGEKANVNIAYYHCLSTTCPPSSLSLVCVPVRIWRIGVEGPPVVSKCQEGIVGVGVDSGFGGGGGGGETRRQR